MNGMGGSSVSAQAVSNALRGFSTSALPGQGGSVSVPSTPIASRKMAHSTSDIERYPLRLHTHRKFRIFGPKISLANMLQWSKVL